VIDSSMKIISVCLRFSMPNHMKVYSLLSIALNLNEALDTRFEDCTEWKLDGHVMSCVGRLGGDEFVMRIDVIQLSDEDGFIENSVTLNLRFAKIVDGIETEELFLAGVNRNRVIGAISNVIRDKVRELGSQFDIDFLVMFVRAGEERRIRVYTAFVDSPLYGIRPWRKVKNVISSDGVFIVCTRGGRMPSNMAAFIGWAARGGKEME